MRIGIDASRAFVKEPTGTERYAYEVITRMLKLPEAKEYEWVIYVRNSPLLFPSLNLREGLGESYIKVVRIPLPYLWTQVGLAWRTWVDRLDVLWVPAHTLPLLRRPPFALPGFGRGLRTVVTIHGIEYEWLPAYENKLQRWYLPMSTIYAVRQAGQVIAVSEFTKKQLIKRLGAEERKIKVVLEGYTPLSYLPPKFSPMARGFAVGGRSKWGVLNKFGLLPQKYILFVGTIQPRKNLERLVEAFAKVITPPLVPPLSLRGGKGELKLVIAGKLGWSYQSVIEAPRKFGVEDRVVMTGYVDDYTRQVLLKGALVYVQPSITEGFGLPVLEAMVAGIPVVCSNGGALAEVVSDAGVVFEPTDTDGIKSCLERVIGDEKLRKDMIRKGRERAKKFRWEKAAQQTLRLIVSEATQTL